MTRHQGIGHCSKCDLPWPLRLSHDGEKAACWVCASCGAVAIGVFDADTPSDCHHNVRLRETFFEHCYNAPGGEKEVAAKLAEEWQAYSGKERRRSERLPSPIEVVVVPLDNLYSPLDESFPAVVSNLSQHGLGLIHTRTIDAPFVAVAMPCDGQRTIQVIARVVRCNARGRFFEIGCELKVRLGSVSSGTRFDG